MSAIYSERMIEQSYHAVWERHFTKVYGMKSYGTFVPGVDEVHTGFDLGFASWRNKYHFTASDFFEWMKRRIFNTSQADNAFLCAYFYQYKLLSEVVSLNRIKDTATKEGLILLGYPRKGAAFRAKLDTVRNTYANGTKRRPFSQHDALCRTAKIQGTEVYYCTPKFDETMGIPKEPTRTIYDLNTTRVTAITPTFRDQKTHYLYMEDRLATNTAWCSEPIPTESNQELNPPPLITPRQLLRLMKAIYISMNDEGGIGQLDFRELALTPGDLERQTFYRYYNALPRSTKIVGFRKSD
jgi:hypothetical protein